MRINDKGQYECAYCGVALEIPVGASPQIKIRAASGRPNVRTISIDRRVIHACEMPGSASSSADATTG